MIDLQSFKFQIGNILIVTLSIDEERSERYKEGSRPCKWGSLPRCSGTKKSQSVANWRTNRLSSTQDSAWKIATTMKFGLTTSFTIQNICISFNFNKTKIGHNSSEYKNILPIFIFFFTHFLKWNSNFIMENKNKY